jgi:putative effector of murein hydrolase
VKSGFLDRSRFYRALRAARRLHVRSYLEAKANGMKHKFPSVPDHTSDQNARRNAGQAIAAFVMALALTVAMGLTREQYVTLLPKSVTTAISMDVAAELGGIAALTGAIVILTGIAGNLLAETVCKVFHITDPIAKGVGIGTSAHAVGTSKALQMGEVEGAMSGLSIAVAGVLTAVLCPVFVNFIN